jgi:hypothetical protein
MEAMAEMGQVAQAVHRYLDPAPAVRALRLQAKVEVAVVTEYRTP